MKIMHVLPTFSKGGGERVVVELANEAFKNGDEITIVAGWPIDPVLLQNSINPGIPVKFIGKNRLNAYSNIVPWIFKNRKFISGFDVLHCHLSFAAVVGCFIKVFFKKRPAIVETCHAVGMAIPKMNQWLQSRMLLFRNGVALMATDPFWNSFIKSHPSLMVEIIPNGISVLDPSKDEDLKKGFRRELQIPENCKYLVGTVGMLRPDRQPTLYVPIFKYISSVLKSDVHFVIAGGGSEFEPIKALVEIEGLSEYVHMPGTVNNPAITMANLDVYISLSVGETAGISMIEASMLTVPVVAIQLSKNYQPKKEDWVWSNTDLEEVAKKIVSLLQNAEERSKMAAFQHEYVMKHFSSQTMYTGYNTFYKRALKNKNISN